MKKEAFPKEWKFLILFSVLTSVFGFWINYSQTQYLTRILEKNLPYPIPYSIPEPYTKTAVVIPGTGSFILVNSSVLLGVFLAIVFILAFYYFIYKK